MLHDMVQQSKKISLSKCHNNNGLLTSPEKIYIPEYDPLKLTVLQAHHDAPSAGHSSREKALVLVSCHYFMLKLQEYIAQYVQNCPTCRPTKPTTHGKHRVLLPLPIPQQEWQEVSRDFVAGLPEVRGTTPSWLSWTEFPNCATSFYATQPSTQNKQPFFTYNIFENHVACPPTSHLTVIPSLPHAFGNPSANNLWFKPACLPPITWRPMDKLNAWTPWWNNISYAMYSRNRTTGLSGNQWPINQESPPRKLVRSLPITAFTATSTHTLPPWTTRLKPLTLKPSPTPRLTSITSATPRCYPPKTDTKQAPISLAPHYHLSHWRPSVLINQKHTNGTHVPQIRLGTNRLLRIPSSSPSARVWTSSSPTVKLHLIFHISLLGPVPLLPVPV